MRRILVCLLVLAVLAGCMAVSAAEDTETVMDQILDRLGEITDQTRGMSDVELAEEIQAMAGEYHVKLNQEQLDFLVSACRGLESVDSAGETVQEYGEKVSRFRQTMDAILDALRSVLDTLAGLFAFLGNLLDRVF